MTGEGRKRQFASRPATAAIRLKRSSRRRRPTATDGRSATFKSERELPDRRRSQFDPLLPVAHSQSGRSQTSLAVKSGLSTLLHI